MNTERMIHILTHGSKPLPETFTERAIARIADLKAANPTREEEAAELSKAIAAADPDMDCSMSLQEVATGNEAPAKKAKKES